jgi:hypothetical protein
VQQKIYEVILRGGKGSVLPIGEYTPERYEKAVDSHIKVLLSF